MAQMVFNMVQTRTPVERLPGIKDCFVLNCLGYVWNLRLKGPELVGAAWIWSWPDLPGAGMRHKKLAIKNCWIWNHKKLALKNWRFSALKNWRNQNRIWSYKKPTTLKV